MTTTTTESAMFGMLRRLIRTSELNLAIDHNASGYTLYLMEGNKCKILEMLGFSVSKSGIYEQMLCTCRVIGTMQQQQLQQQQQKQHYGGPGLIDNR